MPGKEDKASDAMSQDPHDRPSHDPNTIVETSVAEALTETNDLPQQAVTWERVQSAQCQDHANSAGPGTTQTRRILTTKTKPAQQPAAALRYQG